MNRGEVEERELPHPRMPTRPQPHGEERARLRLAVRVARVDERAVARLGVRRLVRHDRLKVADVLVEQWDLLASAALAVVAV